MTARSLGGAVKLVGITQAALLPEVTMAELAYMNAPPVGGDLTRPILKKLHDKAEQGIGYAIAGGEVRSFLRYTGLLSTPGADGGHEI
jgi:hypothetical protein